MDTGAVKGDKVKFQVCYRSSEEVGYLAEELNEHSVTAVGWQTLKFCEYPQELGIAVMDQDESDGSMYVASKHLTQLQLLSHEAKVSTRIELYVGNGANYQEAEFERLGFMALDGNERSEYRARELKSVYIDQRKAQYLRLIVHRPHRNPVNLFDQVGIIALNILGVDQYVDPGADDKVALRAAEQASMKDISNKMDYYHTKEKDMKLLAESKEGPDHALDQFLTNNTLSINNSSIDDKTKRKLMLLEQAKVDAIEIEDFDKAKSIKEMEGEIKKYAYKLVKIEALKKEAVKAEDYDYAKEVKAQCEDLREEMDEMIAELRIPSLMDEPYCTVKRDFTSRINSIDESKLSEIENENENERYTKQPLSPQQEAPFSHRSHNEYETAIRPHEMSTEEEKMIEDNSELDGVPTNINTHRSSVPDSNSYVDQPDSYRSSNLSHNSHNSNNSHNSHNSNNNNSPHIDTSRSRASQRDERIVTYEHGHDHDYYHVHAGDLKKNKIVEEVLPEEPEIIQEEEPELPKHPLDGVPQYLDLPEPEDFTDDNYATASQTGIINVLGEYRAKCLFSKVYALREAAVLKLRLMLQSNSEELPLLTECYSELTTIIKILLDDKIHQVLNKTIDLLEDILRLTANDRYMSKAIFMPRLEPVLEFLVEKLADGNARIRECATKGVDAIISSSVMGPPIVSSFALKPMKKSETRGHAWRPLLARLRLLRDLVSNFGLGKDSGLNLENVMGFPKYNQCFSHSNGEVRDAARDLTVAVEQCTGQVSLDNYLKALRPKQFEDYVNEFERAALVVQGGGFVGRKIYTKQNLGSLSPRAADKHHNAVSKVKGGSVDTAAHRAEEKRGFQDSQTYSQPGGGNDGGGIQCMFCGVGDKSWNEDSLDLHYWKDCPLLAPCQACAQVVEVSSMTDHLLDECEHKENYCLCKKTGLAIRTDDYPQFQTSQFYLDVPEDMFCCPLCYAPCKDTDQDWTKHLCYACAKNPRVFNN